MFYNAKMVARNKITASGYSKAHCVRPERNLYLAFVGDDPELFVVFFTRKFGYQPLALHVNPKSKLKHHSFNQLLVLDTDVPVGRIDALVQRGENDKGKDV